jgi:cytochrome c oxidase cbb3-type subunit 4
METYTLLRQFADSWALLAMTLFFIGVVVFAFRPGSRELANDAARIPLKDD